MSKQKETINYASPVASGIGRLSRRRRREAFKLLIMMAVTGVIAIILLLYSVATIGDDKSDHSFVCIAVSSMIFPAVFGLASLVRFLESRAGD